MRYHTIVIGSGPGGYNAAARIAQRGFSTALVEKAETGGTCLNWGCIPTKALLRSAQVFADCRRAGEFGIVLEGEPKPDMELIVKRSREVAAMLGKGVEALLKKSGVEIIHGHGRLRSAHEVEVDGTVYEAENIVLATGARPKPLGGAEVNHLNILDSKDALQLTILPKSIIVVGSGAIGSEFAHLYATLGSQVTVIEYLPQMMPLEDEEISRTMERICRRRKIGVMTGTAVRSVEDCGETCTVKVEGKNGEQTLEAEKVLIAAGITANIEDLGLEEVGIETERGKIRVDSLFRTNLKNIYAIGDIIPTPALAHVAIAEAKAAADTICGLETEHTDFSLTPSCIFTEPEVASVGLTEREAQEKGIEYRVGKFQFLASGKAAAMGERDGMIKLIFDGEDKLIGAHMIGPCVAEMLGEPTVAAAMGAKAEDIRRAIHAHPTLNEGIVDCL